MSSVIPPSVLAAIGFEGPTMLGWLAAASLPWLVHFWTRRRRAETPWAATAILLAAMQQHSRRVRIRDWLLLAIRSSAIALIAFGAARPVWRISEESFIHERTHHILVLDQSLSMQCVTKGTSPFQKAQRRARQLVENAPAGDAFTVIAWNRSATNVLGRATFEPAAAVRAINSLQPTAAVADLEAAVREVGMALDQAHETFPEVTRDVATIVSDGTATTWGMLEGSSSGDKEQVAHHSRLADEWRKLSARCGVTIENVDEKAPPNIAITNIETTSDGLVSGRSGHVKVQLAGFGLQEEQRVDISLHLDGASIAHKQGKLSPSSRLSLDFELSAPEPGYHVLEARLGGNGEALTADNRRWLAIDVRLRPTAVCFADDVSQEADVARALNPHFHEATDSGIAVDVAPMPALVSTDLSTKDVVYLCNVRSLNAREQRLVGRYVEEGGALVVILGSHSEAAAYNALLAAWTSSHDGESLGSIQIADQPLQGDWRIDPLAYDHPILRPFAGRRRAGLLNVQVSKYYPLSVMDGLNAPSTVMSFSSGDPALLLSQYGKGRVAILATDPALKPGGEAWSTMAISPSFVPVMRELFNYVALDARSTRMNRLAGEPLEVPAAIASAGRGVWRGPDGKTYATPPSTLREGVYHFGEPVPKAPASAVPIAVNVDPRESDLSSVDIHELASSSTNGSCQPAVGNSFDVDGVSLEWCALLGAATLLLLESIAAWLLGREAA